VLIIILLLSSRVRGRMKKIETTFLENLNERDLAKSGKANNLVADLHLAHMTVSCNSKFIGDKLMNTDLQKSHGVNIVNIQRGAKFIAAPSGSDRLFPGDIVGVIGTDEQLQSVLPLIEAPENNSETAPDVNPSDFRLRDFVIKESSPLVGKTPAKARLREDHSTMIVAVKRGDDWVENPGAITFMPGDRLWAVTTTPTVSILEG
ncbi:MAG: TrkA C-terminal domain-containing protein, partial [Muribaculaceae bacterium]|nr:TrkA C-terminal domain-containing protein [Muribaculaceae bacterium]